MCIGATYRGKNVSIAERRVHGPIRCDALARLSPNKCDGRSKTLSVFAIYRL